MQYISTLSKQFSTPWLITSLIALTVIWLSTHNPSIMAACITALALYSTHQSQIIKEEKIKNFAHLLSAIDGFTIGESKQEQHHKAQLKHDFITCYYECLAYAHPSTITAIEHFLEMVKDTTNSSQKDKTQALKKMIGSIRQDIGLPHLSDTNVNLYNTPTPQTMKKGEQSE